MRVVSLALSAAAALLLHAPSADAYAKYALKLPNGDSVPDAPNIGHVDAAGMGGLSAFGKDWTKLGKTGWSVAYCQADSDGDGFTNGQELGDPCCTWTVENPGTLITEGISHPSDKTKTPTNPKLQEKCASGGGAAAGGASNSTGGAADAGPGKVNAGPGGTPEDDDEDDEDETETLKPEPSAALRSTTTLVVSAVSAVVAALLL